MSKQRIENNLKEAMKRKDSALVSVLRMLISAIRNKEIELVKKEAGLSEDELVKVIRAEVKKRRESSDEFEKGGRGDLAAKEKQEAELLSRYLPQELSREEILRIAEACVRDAGAAGQKDFGNVMKRAIAAVGGRADGKQVALAVKQALGR